MPILQSLDWVGGQLATVGNVRCKNWKSGEEANGGFTRINDFLLLVLYLGCR